MKQYFSLKNKENQENSDFAIPQRKKSFKNQQSQAQGRVAGRRNLKAAEKAASK